MPRSDNKIVLSRSSFDIDPAITEGLALRIQGGYRLSDLGFQVVANADLTLAASDVSYVEMSDAGVVSANVTGFTAGATFLYEITTNATQITGVQDLRFSEDADSAAANVADANTEGGALELFRIDIADASADTDVVMANKVRIIDAWIVNTGIAAHATDDHVQLKNGAGVITNEIIKTAATDIIVRAGTIDDTEHEIAAGADLTVTAVKVTNVACIVYVLAVRVQ